MDLIERFVLELSKKKQFDNLEALKRSFFYARKKSFPKTPAIREAYNNLLKTGKIKSDEKLEKILLSKKVRTLSGVAVVAVLTKPYKCPGKCLYCPSEKAMPKSYLSNEPAVMRAILTNFHPYKQVQARLKALQINGHNTDKIELIVMGGTFSYLPGRYQTWYIKECFKAANDFPHERKGNSSLLIEQKNNEKARNRIVGLTLETRPDYINQKEILRFRKLGATRVELGVQTVFDNILKLNKRGHLVKDTVKATKLLKDAGFKVGYHLMPGLLGSSYKKDKELFETIYNDSRFKPDLVKIYPCVVTKNSELYNLWKKKKYVPLNNVIIKKLLIAVKKITPEYVRISRLIRDIPSSSIEAGPNISNLRQIIQREGIDCKCIRCREVKGDYLSDQGIVLNKLEYNASGGREFFLQFTDKEKNKLYAMLRLRLVKDTALIREVHTFGKMVKVRGKEKGLAQHIGLGKKLILEAEKIAKENGFKKIIVISGVGVRGYYGKLGYVLKETYMVKNINK